MILHDFAASVEDRVKRDGWMEIIIPLLIPLFTQLIEQCLNNRSALAAYAEGRRGWLQQAQLRLACRSTVSEAGIRGPLRVGRATTALVEAIHAELTETAAKASGDNDIYQMAIDEARTI